MVFCDWFALSLHNIWAGMLSFFMSGNVIIMYRLFLCGCYFWALIIWFYDPWQWIKTALIPVLYDVLISSVYSCCTPENLSPLIPEKHSNTFISSGKILNIFCNLSQFTCRDLQIFKILYLNIVMYHIMECSNRKIFYFTILSQFLRVQHVQASVYSDGPL